MQQKFNQFARFAREMTAACESMEANLKTNWACHKKTAGFVPGETPTVETIEEYLERNGGGQGLLVTNNIVVADDAAFEVSQVYPNYIKTKNTTQSGTGGYFFKTIKDGKEIKTGSDCRNMFFSNLSAFDVYFTPALVRDSYTYYSLPVLRTGESCVLLSFYSSNETWLMWRQPPEGFASLLEFAIWMKEQLQPETSSTRHRAVTTIINRAPNYYWSHRTGYTGSRAEEGGHGSTQSLPPSYYTQAKFIMERDINYAVEKYFITDNTQLDGDMLYGDYLS